MLAHDRLLSPHSVKGNVSMASGEVEREHRRVDTYTEDREKGKNNKIITEITIL